MECCLVNGVGIGVIFGDGADDNLFWAKVEWVSGWTSHFENEWLFLEKCLRLCLFLASMKLCEAYGHAILIRLAFISGIGHHFVKKFEWLSIFKSLIVLVGKSYLELHFETN